jgi:2-polyprenyl-6-hydroxyphenyl methylase/3-demethylubiquinone-9 3-methyltransferase
VADPGAYLRACAGLLAPGGLMVVATLNRTLKSLVMAKIGAEYILRWLPPGTHDWRQFLHPEQIRVFLQDEPVKVAGPFGVSFNPMTGRWSTSEDVGINYMMTVTRD